jgi:hypothetical protein
VHVCNLSDVAVVRWFQDIYSICQSQGKYFVRYLHPFATPMDKAAVEAAVKVREDGWEDRQERTLPWCRTWRNRLTS